jgi:hypothetical protein
LAKVFSEEEVAVAAGAVSHFSALSQARMLEINGGIANSSSNSRWGFMGVGWLGRLFRARIESSRQIV